VSRQKESLRREMRDRLATVSREERALAGAAIAARVAEDASSPRDATVLLFASLPDEIPTAGLHAALRRRGCVVAYPRVLEGGRMALHRVDAPEEMLPGPYGIATPHPDRSPRLDPGTIDVAFLPGLAWDREGGRLGRGAGYYDRLLGAEEWRGEAWGVFLAVQEVDRLPRDRWDMPLDRVLTERETVVISP
jgi:5-formyltetrahydrofolate cyclo-ligase